jgi:hypothetical protein
MNRFQRHFFDLIDLASVASNFDLTLKQVLIFIKKNT